MSNELKNQDDALVPSQWARELEIDEKIIQEVKLYSALGWASDGEKSRNLSGNEQKMVALACAKTGLSIMGKQMIFLGNSLYVTKSGKITKARMDKECPLRRIETRPATTEERRDAGYPPINDDPAKNEYVFHASVYARVDGGIDLVSTSIGSAALWNIKLFGKQADPRRLCSDMACTRAVSRALSLFYDFFGLESWEEVGMPRVIDVEAKVVSSKERTAKMADNISHRAAALRGGDDQPGSTEEDTPIEDEAKQSAIKDILDLIGKEKKLADLRETFTEDSMAAMSLDALLMQLENLKEAAR